MCAGPEVRRTARSTWCELQTISSVRLVTEVAERLHRAPASTVRRRMTARRSASTPCWPSAASSRRAPARRRRSWRARSGSAARAERAAKPGPARRRATSSSSVDEGRRYVSRGGHQARQRARRARASTSPAGAAWTSARRPAASPTACCSAAPRTSSRSTSPTASSHWSLRNDARVTVIERAQRPRRSTPRRAALRAGPRRRRRLVHLADEGAAAPCWRAARRAFDALAMVKPQFEVGRERVGKGGVVRDPDAAPRGARRRGRGARERRGVACSASRPRGCPGPKGNRETFVLARRGRAAPGRSPTWTRRSRGRRRDRPRRRRRPLPRAPGETDDALRAPDRARARGATMIVAPRPRGDATSTGDRRAGPGIEIAESHTDDVDLCVALGGDGTILRGAARVRRHERARLRRQLRRGRLPGDESTPTRRRRRLRAGARGRLRDADAARRSRSRRDGAARIGDQRHRDPPQASGERVADLAYAVSRRGGRAACAATGSSSPRPRGRRATTSPTAARCWRGAWRASSCRSSRRTR